MYRSSDDLSPRARVGHDQIEVDCLGVVASTAKDIVSSATVLAIVTSLIALAGIHWTQGGVGQLFNGGIHLLLENTCEEFQQGIIWGLGGLGAPGHEVLGSLLEHPDRAVRRLALLRVSITEPGAWRRFLRAGRDVDPEIRKIAVLRICSARPPWIEVAPSLASLARDSDPSVRHAAAESLCLMGPPAAPLLAELLLDSNALTEVEAACGLQGIPSVPPTAIPALLAAVRDGSAWSRWAASGALVRIGDPCVPALRGLLGASRPESREAALCALGTIAPQDGAVMADIERCLHDQDESVRSAADDALRKTRERSSSRSRATAPAARNHSAPGR